MRAVINRAWSELCAGRPSQEIATRIVVAFALAGALWAFACAFLLMEPGA